MMQWLLNTCFPADKSKSLRLIAVGMLLMILTAGVGWIYVALFGWLLGVMGTVGWFRWWFQSRDKRMTGLN